MEQKWGAEPSEVPFAVDAPEIRRLLALSGDRFAILADGATHIGSRGSFRDYRTIEVGTDATLWKRQVLFLSRARDETKSASSFGKPFGETVIRAWDVSFATEPDVREWLTWRLPIDHASLGWTDDGRLWAGDGARGFVLDGMELGWSWYDEVFRDCHPPGTPAGTLYPFDGPYAKGPWDTTPKLPPGGWKGRSS